MTTTPKAAGASGEQQDKHIQTIDPETVRIKLSFWQMGSAIGVVIGAAIFLTTLYLKVDELDKTLIDRSKLIEQIPGIKEDVAVVKVTVDRAREDITEVKGRLDRLR